MTIAQKMRDSLTGSVMLPVAGELLTYRIPQSRELALAGLLPLRMTNAGEAEIEQDSEVIERTIRRLICECSLTPRIVEGKPRTPDQIEYDLMPDDDRAVAYSSIMEDTLKRYYNSAPATESKAQLDSLTLIAYHARKWGLNPVEVADMTPAQFDELMMFSDLLDTAAKKAGE